MTRPQFITNQYIQAINHHLHNLLSNKTDQMWEIEEFAGLINPDTNK